MFFIRMSSCGLNGFCQPVRCRHPTSSALCTHHPAAYRRTCLESHPDKRLAGVDDPAEKARIEDAFKAIQVCIRGGCGAALLSFYKSQHVGHQLL